MKRNNRSITRKEKINYTNGGKQVFPIHLLASQECTLQAVYHRHNNRVACPVNCDGHCCSYERAP